MFLNPSDFAFTLTQEENWQIIRDEFLALPKGLMQPWVQREMHAGDWTVFGLFALGQHIPSARELCPQTAALLDTIPGLSMAGFSRLKAHAHVAPHCGWAASVYRLHLGLVVPENCFIRVSEETRGWQEGKCLIFDDTVNHEAWNDAETPRTVLLLDFLRPGVSADAKDHIPEEVQSYMRYLMQK